MTAAERLMLAFCFGAALGTVLANIIELIYVAVDNFYDKQRKKREDAERASR